MIPWRIRVAIAIVVPTAVAMAVTVTSGVAAAKPVEEFEQTITLRAGWNTVFLKVDAPVVQRARLLRSAAVSRILMRAPVGGGSASASAEKALPAPDWFDDAALWVSRSIEASDNGAYEDAAAGVASGRCYVLYAASEAVATLRGAPSVRPQKWRAGAGTLFGAHGDFASSQQPTVGAYFAASQPLSRAEFYKLSTEGGWKRIEDPYREPLEENGCLFVRAPWGSVYQGPLEVRPAGGGALSFSSDSPELFVRIVNRADKPVDARLTTPSVPTGPNREELPALFAWSARAVAPAGSEVGAETPRWAGIGGGDEGAFVVNVPARGGAVDVVLGVNVAALRAWVADSAEGTGVTTTILTVAGGGARMHVPVEIELGGEVGTPRQLGLWVGGVVIDAVGLAEPEGAEPEKVPQPYRFQLIVHKEEDAEGNASCHLLSDAIEMPGDGDSRVVLSDEKKARERFPPLASGAEGVRRFRTVAYVTDGPVSARAPETDAEHKPCLSPGSAVRFEFKLPHDHPLNPDVHAAHPDHDNLDDSYQRELDAGEEAREFTRTFTLTVSDPDDGREYRGSGWNDSRLWGRFEERIGGAHRNELRTSGAFALFRVSQAVLHR